MILFGAGGSADPPGSHKGSLFWTEDVWKNTANNYQAIPQEEGNMSYMNVPPAPGVTPAQAAQKLRMLVKHELWPMLEPTNVGSAAGMSAKAAETHLSHLESHLTAIDKELSHLVELAKHRRPSETRDAVTVIRAGSIYRARYYLKHARQQMSYAQKGKTDLGKLRKSVTEAYALIQTLPAHDQPTTGKAENTLRAITAMLKVYYGLDVSADESKLPDVMTELLKQVATAKADPGQETETLVDSEGLKVLSELPPPPEPYVIFNMVTGGSFVPADFAFSSFNTNFGDPSWNLAELSPAGWMEGNCSYVAALATLRACRARYSTERIGLKKGGVVIAEAFIGNDITIKQPKPDGDEFEVPEAEEGEGFEAPFKIQGYSDAYKWDTWKAESVMSSELGGVGYAHPFDGPGTTLGWNSGNCSVYDARATLRRCRARWNTPQIRCVDANGKLVGHAVKDHPIKWPDSPVSPPVSPPVPPVPDHAFTTS